jgi:hypothetical protein
MKADTSEQKAAGRRELENAHGLSRETGAKILEVFVTASQNTPDAALAFTKGRSAKAGD